jgi:hypothetical protein
MTESAYDFQDRGIGKVIGESLLRVPPNQRSYAWKTSHVTDLLNDLKEALSAKNESYFLGTVVLVKSDRRLEIADGQQRLSTASIIFARCRDLLRGLGQDDDANSINHDFLSRYDRSTSDHEFLINMNVEDEEFFRSEVIAKDWAAGAPDISEFTYPSNRRLYEASKKILEFLNGETGHLNKSLQISALKSWAAYVEKDVSVVSVTVSDEVGAFRMFETLNDRGLRASQSDILKNYLFSRASKANLDSMHGLWNQMYGILSDTFDDSDEQMVRYIKYYWTLSHGLTRDRELASSIKDAVKSPKEAQAFVAGASAAATDFAAVFQPTHSKWKDYGEDCRHDLAILKDVLNIEQIVPLVFAVAKDFSVVEARKAIKLFVSWSVRFLLGGTGRAGRLDKQYAELANAVGTGTVTTARQLRDALSDKVPNDEVFKRAVRTAKVSKAVLARYYLLSFEVAANQESGELEPSRDTNVVNLEHILPKTFCSEFGIPKPEYEDLVTRLGNQTVMLATDNRDIGMSTFADKRETFVKSKIGLTRDIGEFTTFGRDQIDQRQSQMAELAASIWTTKLG